jgi:hypothetical protein
VSTPTNVTQIDTTYLTGLQNQLQTILTDVQNQLKGTGASSDPNTSGWLGPVDQNLAVQGGDKSTFNAAAALNTALGAMGGSVNSQLTWLQKVLTDMINEITTTIQSFSGTESLNNEAVTTLISDFQNTISDMSNGPGGSSSSTPPPSGSTPPPSSATPPPSKS